MILSIDQILLVQYVRRQLDQFFPDNLPTDEIEAYIDDVLDRIVYCFSAINDKYYTKDSQTYFNHLNSDHYAMFLYFLSNTLYRNGADVRLCEKIFYLNKMLHGIDVFYSVELPEIFCLFIHWARFLDGRNIQIIFSYIRTVRLAATMIFILFLVNMFLYIIKRQ